MIARPVIGNNRRDTQMATRKDQAEAGGKVTKSDDGREQMGLSILPATCEAGGLAIQFYQRGGKSLEQIIKSRMSTSNRKLSEGKLARVELREQCSRETCKLSRLCQGRKTVPVISMYLLKMISFQKCLPMIIKVLNPLLMAFKE